VDLDVVFLGTAGSTPTARRAPAATLIRRGGDRILLDCGEGTQRQLLRSQIGLVDLDVVLFSHYHADHVLGLPGLLKTYDLRGREQGLELYGPSGLSDLLTIFAPIIGRLGFPLHARELAAGDDVPGAGYRLIAHPVAHRGPAVAWELCEDERPGQFDVAEARRLGVPEGPAFGELQRGSAVTTPDGSVVTPAAVLGPARRGRTLVFSGDTRPCAAVRRAALGADLLVHEASFSSEDAERARETRHSTAAEAAELAAASEVKLLALTHLGARATARMIKDEARAIFPATVVPRDFDTIELPLPERGAPELRRGGAHPEEEKAP
jgi:ribonuclease Z